MKRMRYNVMGYLVAVNEATGEEIRKEAPAQVETAWSEEAEAHARSVAIGEVTVYDDGKDIEVSTFENRVATLEDNSAKMTEALDLLLSGATEEVGSDA